jgi:ABC-2 type transport system permease protein
MNNIRVIAWHEYVVNVRRGGFIFTTLLFPALGLMGVIVATFFSGQATRFFDNQFGPGGPQRVGVVDQSGLFTPIPDKFARQLTAFPDDASAKRALIDKQITAYIVIPQDYVTKGGITSYSRGGFSSAIAVDRDTLNPFLLHGLLSGKVDDAVLTRASDPGQLTRVTLDDKGQPTNGNDSNPLSFIAGFVASYAISLLLFMSIFISSGYLLRSVSEEKENRVMEVVLSSVSARELLAGKVIGLGALGLTQVGVWLLSGVVLSAGLGAVVVGALAVLNPGVFALVLVYFVLGYLLYGTLMATAGSLGTSMRESQQIAGLFSFAAALPWMVNGFVIANPNMILARILSWFPLSAPMMMMLRLPYGDIPVIDVVGSIAVLALTVPLVIWGGAKIFRASLLMYGKRPALKEIVRVLRAA